MVDWGDVPAWIQAGATVLLLIAASVAGWYTHRIYKIESARDARYTEERRRDQASQVSAWIEYRSYTTLPREGPTGPGHFVVLKNASGLPVFDTSLMYLVRDTGKFVDSIHEVGVLPPGEMVSQVMPLAAREVHQLGLDPTSLLVQIGFVDSHGQRWERPPDGGLESLTITIRSKADGLDVETSLTWPRRLWRWIVPEPPSSMRH